MVSIRNVVSSFNALPPASMSTWPASTPAEAPRSSVSSLSWSKVLLAVPRRMALAAKEARPALPGGSYMAPPFTERRATTTGMVVFGKTITVRPLSSTRRVIVSGPRALLAASLTNGIVVFHSVHLSSFFLGGDEPADRAIVPREVGARHSLHVFRGDGGQLVKHLVVHIG